MTAQQIFNGGPVYVKGFPTFNYGALYWSTQPNCQVFGVNTPYDYAKARFGWSANDINVCETNDTAIGLGLMNGGSGGPPHGAGYECLYGPCSQGVANNGGNGLLWAK